MEPHIPDIWLPSTAEAILRKSQENDEESKRRRDEAFQVWKEMEKNLPGWK